MKEYKLRDYKAHAYQWNGVPDEYVRIGMPKIERTFDMELYAEDYPTICDDCNVPYVNHGYAEYGNHLGCRVCKGEWVVISLDGSIRIFSDHEFKRDYEEA